MQINQSSDYELGRIADSFLINTNKRINAKDLEPDLQVVYEVMQDELFKALRVLENCISKQS